MDHCVRQFQYNYLDVEYQAGTRGQQYASSKGLAVVVMEPLRGGALARNIPPAVQALWDSVGRVSIPGQEGGNGIPPYRRTPADWALQWLWNQPEMSLVLSGMSTMEQVEWDSVGRVSIPGQEGGNGIPPYRKTPADWALQWLWNQPEVSLVLSGMCTMEQVEQNLASADRSGVGTMTEAGLAFVARAREAYLSLMAVPCTSCQYCLPCPNGVAIPDVLGVYNEAKMFGDLGRASQFYGWIDEKARGDACIECGECLEKCPQHIEIPERMKVVHEALAPKPSLLPRPRRGCMSAEEHEIVAAEQLPCATAWLFPEYDFASMDLEYHRGVITERLLERGTWEQLRWPFWAYGEGSVADWVRQHGLRLLSSRSFALWRLALDITDYEAPAWAVEARAMGRW